MGGDNSNEMKNLFIPHHHHQGASFSPLVTHDRIEHFHEWLSSYYNAEAISVRLSLSIYVVYQSCMCNIMCIPAKSYLQKTR